MSENVDYLLGQLALILSYEEPTPCYTQAAIV
jgi:hypothetical protein